MRSFFEKMINLKMNKVSNFLRKKDLKVRVAMYDILTATFNS